MVYDSEMMKERVRKAQNPFSVHVIDIQDTYLLAYEKQGAGQQWQAFKGILEAIDSSVLVENIGKQISGSVKNRMCAVIKDIVQPGDTRTTTMQQVAEDIDVLTNVIALEERYSFDLPLRLPEDKLQKSSEIVQNACKPVLLPITKYQAPFNERFPENALSESSGVQAADYAVTSYADYNETAKVDNAQTFTIIWSRLNNMSIVYEECGRHEVSANAACETCLNFEVVQKVVFADGHVEHFKAMFHQKIWDSLHQLQEKVKCFQQLYEMDDIACESCTTTERQRVLRILQDGFELSQDPAKRMKASELTAILSAKLAMTGTEQAAGFKQRLPAYLLEAGLQKKRLSEGIFYYGIQASVSTRFEQNRAHNVQELEEQRDAQMQDVKASGYRKMTEEDSLAGLGHYLKQQIAPSLEEAFTQKILPHEIPRDGEKHCKPVEANNVVYSSFSNDRSS